MRKIWSVLRQEFTQTIRQKGYIFIVISVPLLAMVGYSIAQVVQDWVDSEDPELRRVGYVDLAGVLVDDNGDAFDIEFIIRKGIELPDIDTDKQKLIIKNIDSFKNNEYKVKLGSIIPTEKRNYYIENRFNYLKEKLQERI